MSIVTITKLPVDFVLAGKKISTIKMIRQATGLGLRESKDLIESWLPIRIVGQWTLDLVQELRDIGIELDTDIKSKWGEIVFIVWSNNNHNAEIRMIPADGAKWLTTTKACLVDAFKQIWDEAEVYVTIGVGR